MLLPTSRNIVLRDLGTTNSGERQVAVGSYHVRVGKASWIVHGGTVSRISGTEVCDKCGAVIDGWLVYNGVPGVGDDLWADRCVELVFIG